MESKKRRAIGEKLTRVKSYDVQKVILEEWAEGWENDQKAVIEKLRKAAQRDDHSEIMHMIQQLDGLTEKRFIGLYNVIRKVSDPDRKLKITREEENKNAVQ